MQPRGLVLSLLLLLMRLNRCAVRDTTGVPTCCKAGTYFVEQAVWCHGGLFAAGERCLPAAAAATHVPQKVRCLSCIFSLSTLVA